MWFHGYLYETTLTLYETYEIYVYTHIYIIIYDSYIYIYIYIYICIFVLLLGDIIHNSWFIRELMKFMKIIYCQLCVACVFQRL